MHGAWERAQRGAAEKKNPHKIHTQLFHCQLVFGNACLLSSLLRPSVDLMQTQTEGAGREKYRRPLSMLHYRAKRYLTDFFISQQNVIYNIQYKLQYN